jgi:hypothetical protein
VPPGPKPHAAWACLNAGARGSKSEPTGNTIPRNDSPARAVVDGSGKFGSPWLRTHAAHASAVWRSLADAGAGVALGPPPGTNLLHLLSADWNVGEDLTAEPGPNAGPALEPGSGNCGTPCERMQSANWSAVPELPLDSDTLELPENPHPASAGPQAIAMSVRMVRPVGTGRTCTARDVTAT